MTSSLEANYAKSGDGLDRQKLQGAVSAWHDELFCVPGCNSKPMTAPEIEQGLKAHGPAIVKEPLTKAPNSGTKFGTRETSPSTALDLSIHCPVTNAEAGQVQTTAPSPDNQVLAGLVKPQPGGMLGATSDTNLAGRSESFSFRTADTSKPVEEKPLSSLSPEEKAKRILDIIWAPRRV